LLIVINLFSGIGLSWIWLLWPIFSFILLLLAYGLAVVLAIFRVFFSDISEVIRHVLNLWRWTMPIIYTAEVFPERLQPYLRINPPYTFIEVLRNLFLENALPGLYQLAIITAWLVTIFSISSILHKRFESEVRDNL
jgi:ABC-type polysaccharide/polyol phosphate export permease